MVITVLIYSQDYQYGQYLKSLVQQLEPAHDLHVVNSPPARISPAPGLAIVRAEPGHNDFHQVMKRLSWTGPDTSTGCSGNELPG
jgi:hypothetical protein